MEVTACFQFQGCTFFFFICNLFHICLHFTCQLFYHISIFSSLASNIQKVVPMAQGLLGPLMHCLMPRKSFLCKFGIDFAFYNLARCLALVGSCLCPSLNIFGLKTGSLGWRKDTNRIYIFTTRQSGGLRLARGEGSWSDIYNYPAGQSIHSSQTFLHRLFSRFSSA